MKDSLFSTAQTVAPFQFDQNVVAVFPDMIARSVPNYGDLLRLLGLWAARYVQPHTTIYDLGCSLGAATLAVRRHISQAGCHIVGVDSSEAMIAQAEKNISADTSSVPVTLHCADIRTTPLQNASLVLLNFTLQFTPISDRLPLLQRIAHALHPQGVLILSEKVAWEDSDHQQRLYDLHLDFKRVQGYSELEIAQKRTALEKVLLPETVQNHRQRLLSAGFAVAEVWHQSLQFVSFYALKGG